MAVAQRIQRKSFHWRQDQPQHGWIGVYALAAAFPSELFPPMLQLLSASMPGKSVRPAYDPGFQQPNFYYMNMMEGAVFDPVMLPPMLHLRSIAVPPQGRRLVYDPGFQQPNFYYMGMMEGAIYNPALFPPLAQLHHTPWLRRRPAPLDVDPQPGWLGMADPADITATLTVTLEGLHVMIDAAVNPLAVPGPWLTAAAHAATMAGTSGSYHPVLLVDFLDHMRTFSTVVVPFRTTETLLERLADGGVGAITRDLEELTDTIRLSGASVRLTNIGNLAKTFTDTDIPLDNTPVRIRWGYEGLDEQYYVTLFTGNVDRYSKTLRTLDMSLVDSSVQQGRDLSIPAGPPFFPDAPTESRALNLPIFVGVLTHAAAIRVSGSLIGQTITGTLAFAMNNTQQQLWMLEVDALFPASGTVTVAGETMTYTGRTLENIGGITYLRLNNLIRPAPVAHAVGAEVAAVIAAEDPNPTFVTGFGVRTLNAIRKNGTALTSGYTVVAQSILGKEVPVITLDAPLLAEDVITIDVNALTPVIPFGAAPPPPPPPAEESQDNLFTLNGGFEAGNTSLWTTTNGGVLTLNTPDTVTPVALVNGGFETGDITGWITAAPGANVSVGMTNPPAHVGSWRVSLLADAGTAQSIVELFQDIATIANQPTSWSLFYRNSAGATASPPQGEAQLAIQPTGNPTSPNAFDLRFPIALDWTFAQGTFVPDSDSTRVILRTTAQDISNPNVACYFDEVIFDGSMLNVNSPPPPVEGVYRAELRGGLLDDGDVYRELPTVPNRTYRLRFYYKNGYVSPTDHAVTTVSLRMPMATGGYADQVLPLGDTTADVWTLFDTTFTAGAESTTRITVKSQYTNTPLSTFLDAFVVHLVPAGTVAGETVPLPILSSETGENPIDAMLWLLGYFYDGATYNAAAFARAKMQLEGWKFRSLLTNPGQSNTLLQRMGHQCKSLVFLNRTGDYDIIVLDSSRETVFGFDTTNVVEDSFASSSVPTDSLYTDFSVYYRTQNGGSTEPADYAGVTHCSPTETSHPDGDDLVATCAEALTLYGRHHHLNFFADFVHDFTTANGVLSWLVNRFAIRKDVYTLRSWLDVIGLRLGEVVRIEHPVIGDAEDAVLAEVVGLHIDPQSLEPGVIARSIGPASGLTPGMPLAPLAFDDVALVRKNIATQLFITANDVAGDGATLDLASVDLDPATAGRQTTYTVPGQGTFVVDNAGVVTFTPVTDFEGDVVASYTIADDDGQVSNTASITVNVREIENRIVAGAGNGLDVVQLLQGHILERTANVTNWTAFLRRGNAFGTVLRLQDETYAGWMPFWLSQAGTHTAEVMRRDEPPTLWTTVQTFPDVAGFFSSQVFSVDSAAYFGSYAITGGNNPRIYRLCCDARDPAIALLNGGFENDLEAWQTLQPMQIAVGTTAPTAQEGSKRAALTSVAGGANAVVKLWQDVETVAGCQVQFSVWYRNDPAAVAQVLDINDEVVTPSHGQAELVINRPGQPDGNAYVKQALAIQSGAWTQVTGTFTPTGATTRLELRALSAQVGQPAIPVYWDNLTLDVNEWTLAQQFTSGLQVSALGEFQGMLYAAVEHAASIPTLWYSMDGYTWNQVGMSPFGTMTTIQDFAVYGGAFWASAYHRDSHVCAVWRSTDGMAWSVHHTFATVTHGRIYQLATDGTRLYVGLGVVDPAGVAMRGEVWAYDGVSWSLDVDLNSLSGAPSGLPCVTALYWSVEENRLLAGTGDPLQLQEELNASIYRRSSTGVWSLETNFTGLDAIISVVYDVTLATIVLPPGG
jgi:hypothetical protein